MDIFGKQFLKCKWENLLHDDVAIMVFQAWKLRIRLIYTSTKLWSVPICKFYIIIQPSQEFFFSLLDNRNRGINIFPSSFICNSCLLHKSYRSIIHFALSFVFPGTLSTVLIRLLKKRFLNVYIPWNFTTFRPWYMYYL